MLKSDKLMFEQILEAVWTLNEKQRKNLRLQLLKAEFSKTKENK